MKNIAVILAGGSGTRLGADRPKQFLEAGGKTILEHAVDAFHNHEGIDEVLIVSNPAFLDVAEEIAARRGWCKLRAVLPGGKERSDSSLAAIDACRDEDANLILHDAVRPLVSESVITRVLAALETEKAVGVAVPCVDTILVRNGDYLSETPDRTSLMRAQTPQAFRLDLLVEAYRRALADPAFRATDDCGVVKNYMPEIPIRLVEGEERNFKVTHPDDLEQLRRILAEGVGMEENE